MKKFFATAMMFCLVSVCAMAGIKVTEGDKKVFKNAEGKVALEIILDGATYDDKMPLKEKFEDIALFKNTAISGFSQDFNKVNKKLQIVEKPTDVKFKISFKVTKVDQFYNVMGFLPGNATKIWGTITITDAAGTVLSVVEVDEVDGGSNPSPTETISDAFEKIGEKVGKMK